MDVSSILEAHAKKHESILVEKETPLETDAGLLAITDLNSIDSESYNSNLEEHLQSLARDGVQVLLQSIFSLPTTQSPDGPLAQLPPPVFQLPRAKPLPKPKAKTKWELFAAAKGIQHRKRDKKVWDEEKQDWVNRWGWGGKNKEVEEQWITEVPANADPDYDPRSVAKAERKARVAKNSKQQAQNLARAKGQSSRKNDIDRTLAHTRISTASMGKFDRQLDGEKKIPGVKRKFDPIEAPVDEERKASLALMQRMDSDAKKMRKDPSSTADDSVLNVRKAIRNASRGRGGVALGRDISSSRGSKRGRGKR